MSAVEALVTIVETYRECTGYDDLVHGAVKELGSLAGSPDIHDRGSDWYRKSDTPRCQAHYALVKLGIRTEHDWDAAEKKLRDKWWTVETTLAQHACFFPSTDETTCCTVASDEFSYLISADHASARKIAELRARCLAGERSTKLYEEIMGL